MAEVRMEDLKGNSIKKPKPDVEKIDPKDVEVIASGRKHKKPMGRRIGEVFISEEADTVGKFIVEDVIIPGVKDALLDILHGSIDRIFGGTVRGGYNSYRRQRETRTSYESYYDRDRRRDRDRDRDRSYSEKRRARRSDDFTTIEVDTRNEREAVLRRMGDYIEDYGYVTVAQVKRMIGIEIESTDSDWGWYDMRDIRHYPEGGKFIIEMGPPDSLD